MRIRVALLSLLIPFAGAVTGAPAAVPASADEREKDEPPETVAIYDFESETLSTDWSAVGKIGASRLDLPQPGTKGAHAPAGRGVTVTTEGNAGLYLKSGVAPGDWSDFEEVHFWVHRDAEEAAAHPKSVLEVQAYEPRGRGRRWRKVEITHTGWKRFSLPLRWFRHGGRRNGRWDHLDRIGFWFRDATKLTIDAIVVTRGKAPGAAFLGTDELASVAFPGLNPVAVRTVEKDGIRLLTNAPDLDTDRLMARLVEVRAAIGKDFPFLPPAARPPTLLVFLTREQYEEYTPRFALRMNSTGDPPKSAGFTLHGIATAWWNEEHKSLRPTYTHEFVHSVLAQTARLPNKSEWLQEGVASLYQLRYHPQENIADIVREGLSKESFRSPLQRLLDGERIETIRYWQAMTVIEMLLRNQAYKPHLGKLFEGFYEKRSTNIAPHLESVFKKTWAGFEADWRKHCAEVYGAPREDPSPQGRSPK